ncbi:FAD-dependent oxidoreductase [Gordonia polyisoprenivorans]|uniref:FAD-dependent oxidoreductase n=1 Tax=Gordonia polyisoprenivorans TaxID=84595 RepID=A0A846WS28_9ACTN|nr:FAD-dependent oxidoreductase [Gordonia polyisoprenivorans]NKY04345.1 FAD-dependent oxidoreductase [Gordonia polyisoprenivorans]WCB37129.1 FAD-dependent oxidoreductase [Gordonia polyisoprenivorans]
MSRPRVVIAGLGDTGTLTAIHLARRADVVGITVAPGLISGQELGMRLTRPEAWAHEYALPYRRYRALDAATIVHGRITSLDPDVRRLTVARPDGTTLDESYDALVIATGVTNGFWRTTRFRDEGQVSAELADHHRQVRQARSVIVVGGGASAVSAAANIAAHSPDTKVDLYFPGPSPLRTHHPRTWRTVGERLERAGVRLHPDHRAVLDDVDTTRLDAGTVHWSTGQPPAQADLVVWAVGRTAPNTDGLPTALLDDDGFVQVTPTLQNPLYPNIFAVGDVAATDPLRSSARNRADRLVAHNVRAHLRGGRLRTYRPPPRRWGSVLGPQSDGLQVFAPNGRAFRFPAWAVERVLWPVIVRRGIYHGVRPEREGPDW